MQYTGSKASLIELFLLLRLHMRCFEASLLDCIWHVYHAPPSQHLCPFCLHAWMFICKHVFSVCFLICGFQISLLMFPLEIFWIRYFDFLKQVPVFYALLWLSPPFRHASTEIPAFRYRLKCANFFLICRLHSGIFSCRDGAKYETDGFAYFLLWHHLLHMWCDRWKQEGTSVL